MPIDPKNMQELLNEMMKDKPSTDDAAASAQEALTNAMNQIQGAAGSVSGGSVGAGMASIGAGIGSIGAGMGSLAGETSFSITLPNELAGFVGGLVGSGRYADRSDVIRDALRRMSCDPCFQTPDQAGKGSAIGAAIGGQIAGMKQQMKSMSSPLTWDQIQSTSGDVPPGVAGLMGLRRVIGLVQRDIEVNRGNKSGPLDLTRGLGSEREYTLLLAPIADKGSAEGWRVAPLRVTMTSVSDVEGLKAVLNELEDRMSEMSEMYSMRLQMAMDRRSKIISTLSNILKKLASAQDEIVRNLK